jgi:glycosyltransferase involved in cell wall biosynthesis
VYRTAARWRTVESANLGRDRYGLIWLYGTLVLSRWSIGVQLRRWASRYRLAPIFLVVSHHHLSRPRIMQRIRRIFRMRCVGTVHDLIPMEYPEFFTPGFSEKHRRAVEVTTRLFDAVFVPSQFTANALRRFAASNTNLLTHEVKVHVVPPGIETFEQVGSSSKVVHSAPYFIILGTIEPRKNHLLLLNLWRRLATTMDSPPRLIVIGVRGWENEQVVDILERSRLLHDLVEERGRMSDQTVASLLSRACALLSPSIAEGFGMPLAEALTAGVPVICSDIPVFREVGGSVPDYADPLDLIAWQDLIVDYSQPNSIKRAAQMQRLSQWRPIKWADHFALVEKALGEVSDLDCERQS